MSSSLLSKHCVSGCLLSFLSRRHLEMRGLWPTTTAVALVNSFKSSSKRTEHTMGEYDMAGMLLVCISHGSTLCVKAYYVRICVCMIWLAYLY